MGPYSVSTKLIEQYLHETSLTLAVVIPAYKCAKQIPAVLSAIPTYINHIIVVDDASPDAMSAAVGSIQDERVIYIQHTHNQGVGGAMLTGYQKALALNCDITVKVDGDGQMNLDYIPSLLIPILQGQADYTKGNRFLYLHDLKQMPKQRLLGNIGLTFLTKVASGYWNIFDPVNGFTAIHQQALSLIRKNNIHPRYFFESSLLIELNILGAVAVDVPIPAQYGDETSALSSLQSLFEFPLHLLKGFIRRIFWQYFLYNFTLVSLFIILGVLLTLLGSIWGLYHWYISIISQKVASTGTVMLAVLPVIMGFQLLLQAIGLDIQNVPKFPIQKRSYPFQITELSSE